MDLQSRNASDSSDHVVTIADRLRYLGCGVPTGRKNPRRRKIAKSPILIRFSGQEGTRRYQSLHQYLKILAACNIQTEFINIAQSEYFVVLMHQ